MPFPRRNRRWFTTFNTEQETWLLREQGYDSLEYGKELETIRSLPKEKDTEAIERLVNLHKRMQENPGLRRKDWPYVEPSILADIRKERPDGPRRLSMALDEATLKDRIHGAWLGRVAGCMLGKPVEGAPYERMKELGEYFGEWPLEGYIPYDPNAPEHIAKSFWNKPCLRPNIVRGERDDDTDYTIAGLRILEEYGPGFTPEDVADSWLHLFPYCTVYTAELVAYTNLVNFIPPPESAYRLNGFREWIGAQIRADGWACSAPGWPEMAAEFAHRDASISHVKNGIYGEMFFAAAISAALVLDDLDKVLDVALSEIPKNCRLAEAIRETRKIAASHADFDSAWKAVWDQVGQYSVVHTINNACLVVLGLLYSGGDFGRGIACAVMGGADTDCNGATAGSILGALLGTKGIAPQWTLPLHDTLDSCVIGFGNSRISELAERSYIMSRRVLGAEGRVTEGSGYRPAWEGP